MDSPKKKRHSHAELIEIFSQKKIPDEFHSRFINEYDRIFNELYEDAKDWIDDDFNEDESVQSSALDVTFMFVEPFLEQIEIGHSAEWAEIMAKYSEEDENVAFHYAYQGVFEKDSAKAIDELIIHCKCLNGDEHFVRYLLYLFQCGDGYSEPLEKAKVYSEIYNKQIELGKSNVFAHEYADLIAEDVYIESYCEAYATIYDQSLKQGKSEQYARRYAYMYSEWIGNHYGKLSDAYEDSDCVFWNEKMIGNMKGWEYANENELSDRQSSIKIYENIHINTYYADIPPLPKMNNEQIDKMILEKAVESYERLKSNE